MEQGKGLNGGDLSEIKESLLRIEKLLGEKSSKFDDIGFWLFIGCVVIAAAISGDLVL